MAKRKKRLEKGVESIEMQIEKHRDKIREFGHEKEWLKDYWKKQIESLEEEKENREKLLKKLKRK